MTKVLLIDTSGHGTAELEHLGGIFWPVKTDMTTVDNLPVYRHTNTSPDWVAEQVEKYNQSLTPHGVRVNVTWETEEPKHKWGIIITDRADAGILNGHVFPLRSLLVPDDICVTSDNCEVTCNFKRVSSFKTFALYSDDGKPVMYENLMETLFEIIAKQQGM